MKTILNWAALAFVAGLLPAAAWAYGPVPIGPPVNVTAPFVHGMAPHAQIVTPHAGTAGLAPGATVQGLGSPVPVFPA
ncbi:MAG TPA: hypothetical protein VMF30_10605, partial [Pirellulales bacterium]|nr:hypothetical protein [Pirellulales bacterium]